MAGQKRVEGQLSSSTMRSTRPPGHQAARAVDNADAALWPGQFVNVSVRLYEQADALIVPSQAVQSGPDGQYVYIVGGDMLAELRRSRYSAPTASARSWPKVLPRASAW